MIKRISVFFAAVLIVAACGTTKTSAPGSGQVPAWDSPAAVAPKAEIEALKAGVLDICKRANLPSMQVCLTEPGKTISFTVTNEDFYADPVHAKYLFRPLDNLTQYEACSISKVPLSYLACKMADQGKLDLDKPLYDYFPQILGYFKNEADYDRAKRLTPRICMTHRTGLDNKTYKEKKMEFKFPEGEYHYSGPGIFLLQRTLEHIWGEPLQDYSKRELFDPLGMHHTNYIWQDYNNELSPYGFLTDTVTFNKWGADGKPRANAAYSMRTTAEEFTKFLYFWMDGADLSPEMYKAMTEEYIEAIDGKERGKAYRGLGWVVCDDVELGHFIYHGASNRSFRGMMGCFPDKRKTFVYFFNGTSESYNVHGPMTQLLLGTSAFAVPWREGKALPEK
ncbi:MAG: beta-lactamase family protein [Bacteroidales bacterium]|nr:beta-lactamase family protein [Bacteroidales bacterium]